MFRFLLWVLTFVLIYRLIVWLRKKGILLPDRARETPQSREGRSKGKDFNGLEIEDADFEEIED